MSLPLQGKKIIITREQNKASVFAEKIRANGGIPIIIPLLKISCKDEARNKNILSQLDRFRWVFFTSANGAQCFFQMLHRYQVPMEIMQEKKIAAVGVKTGESLESYGITADFIPTIYNAETMAEEFLENDVSGPILLVRGNLSRDVLPRVFSQQGMDFDWVEVYETIPKVENEEKLRNILQEPYDFITFTSPSAADAFYQFTGAAVEKPCVSIGTTTEKRLAQLGFPNIITAKEFTIDGMIECMKQFLEKE